MRSFISLKSRLILKFRSRFHRYHFEYLHGMFDPVVVRLDMQTPLTGCRNHFGMYTTPFPPPARIDGYLGYPSASFTRCFDDAPSHRPPKARSV